MKILIVGAGVIGSIYGWALSEAGNEVVHLLRPGRAALWASGMNIDILDKRKGQKKHYIGNYSIKTTESLNNSDSYDLVIVPTKHFDIINVLKQIVPQTKHADYLLLTQNWHGTEEIEKIIAPTRFVFGDAGAGGSFEAGTLVAAILSISFEENRKGQNHCAKKISDLFQKTNVKISYKKNILHNNWAQYAANAGWWPAIVQAGSLAAVVKNDTIFNNGLQAVRECLQVVAARGVDLSKYPDVNMYMGNLGLRKFFIKLGMRYVAQYSKVFKRTAAHALGDPREIKTSYDDLMKTGQSLGIHMPVMTSFESVIRKL